jgi:hypothetical protein
MKPDWTKAPEEAQWYQSATGLFLASWFFKDEGIYYACLEGTNEWFKEVYQEGCKEWQWIAREEIK